jgi:23S rRNA pseudouridine1911/1915/1917 synthase
MITLPILFEDADMLVINKPPGVVVNRAESVKGETVQEWAEPRVLAPDFPILSEDDAVFQERAGIAHRIDKETSGCLLIAKNTASFVELQRQFKERIVKKTYLAIVHGAVTPADGEIKAPVGRLPWNRERFGVVPDGKEAVTRYTTRLSWQVIHGKQKEFISLMELYPETGRTHQIRVHMKYINHPIVGDFQYAGRKTSRADRVWAPRVMLHAYKIVFLHPVTHVELAIEAPIPDDMSTVIPPQP